MKKAILSVIFLFLAFQAACASDEKEKAGKSKGSFIFGGYERRYLVHVPLHLDRDKPVPLVFVLHGGGGSAKRMVQLTKGGFDALADKEGFIVVYPDGVGKHWNDGRGFYRYRAQRENIDDVGFISALIDRLTKSYNIDTKSIYVTGVSNGAMMSLRLACELSDRIVAIAPVVGAMPVNLASSCRPARSVSILFINGTDDPLVPWEGGEVRFGHQRLGKILSVPETVSTWVRHDACPSLSEQTKAPDTDPYDGTRIRKDVYSPCDDGVEIVFVTVEGGGHTWPGGYQYADERIVGKTSEDIDACKVIWDFFKRHRRS